MEETEVKREQLREMRSEASEVFANTLVDTAIVQDSCAISRVDQYTHPNLACYGNKIQNSSSQSSRDNLISHYSSGGSGNPMLQLPSSPSLGVSNCYVFKSRLQEYAQKVGFSTPFYDTTKEGPSHEPFFRSAVTVNNIRYESLPGFSTRKAAEQSAAEVALTELAKRGDTKDCMFQPVHELGLCKNLLQEYAQKMNYAMPTYECKREDTPGRGGHFSCSVGIGGIRYIGAAARTKKEAEIKAARTALLAIQTSPSQMGANPNEEETKYTVVPAKRKEPAPKQEAIKTRKPKKGRVKKRKFLNKRQKVSPAGNGSMDGTLNTEHEPSESFLVPNLEVSDCPPIGTLQKDGAFDEGQPNTAESKPCEGNDSSPSVVTQEGCSALASNVSGSSETNGNTCLEQEGLSVKASATTAPIQNEPATPAVTL